ncbi:MAG TPA: hypothetical protein VGV90_17000 [Solirubrobacteraceae bacterium]|nr:hypothetical protein [Solirubrobacteraceae bacterium]
MATSIAVTSAVALELDDVQVSARKGRVGRSGKGDCRARCR